MFDQNKLKEELERVTLRRSLDAPDSLSAVIGRLDHFVQFAQLDGKMKHYLERRSYAKALDYLNDPNLPHQP